MAGVALFVPCYVEVLRPSERERALRVLRALGEAPEVVDGGCCGQPAFNSGFRDEASVVGRSLARRLRGFDRVVILSGSCTAMVQHYLPDLVPRARPLAARVSEFAAYVASHPRLEQLRLRLEGVVAYHDSCHLRRELAGTELVVALLHRIQGLDLRRLRFEDECCGFGGTFSVKLPEVSVRMAEEKLADVRSAGARALVSTDLSCLAHLEATARGLGEPLETWTVADLLAAALEGTGA